MKPTWVGLVFALVGCSTDNANPHHGTGGTDGSGASTGGGSGGTGAIADANGTGATASGGVAGGQGGAGGSDGSIPTKLGSVTGVIDMAACPQGAPPGAACKSVTVGDCPGLESESVNATIAIVQPTASLKGTIVHFSGGGGEGFQGGNPQKYGALGFLQVYIAWMSDWEQTTTLGILPAGCRPATVLRWIFDEPILHAGSRTHAFCAEGFSGGSGQLGYALAHYGLGDYLDYVNELSGPPFARIDLGCDGNAPTTATVCGAQVTMKLPAKLDGWENVPAGSCGSTSNTAATLDRFKNDSIAIGGVYAYPQTRVEFFDCTNQATAVTAMAQIYHDLISSEKAYHCYSAADGCQGEGLGTGANDAMNAMIAGCTPRH